MIVYFRTWEENQICSSREVGNDYFITYYSLTRRINPPYLWPFCKLLLKMSVAKGWVFFFLVVFYFKSAEKLQKGRIFVIRGPLKA